MGISNITFGDPTSSLTEIRKLANPTPNDLAIIRAVQSAPVAARDWENRVSEYLNRATQFEEQHDTDDNPVNAEAWIYMPLIFWPSSQLNFMADVLTIVQSDVTATVVLPTYYDNLRAAITTFISEFYPDGTPEYHMFATSQTAYAKDDTDSDIHPDNYVPSPSSSVITSVGNTSNATKGAVAAAVNDIIWGIKTSADGVDVTKGGEFPQLVSYPICLLYVILKFLRSLIAGTGSGNFVSSTEWSDLSAAASVFLTNV